MNLNRTKIDEKTSVAVAAQIFIGACEALTARPELGEVVLKVSDEETTCKILHWVNDNFDIEITYKQKQSTAVMFRGLAPIIAKAK